MNEKQANFKKGIYEQILSQLLENKLSTLDEKFGHQKEEIDKEEASVEIAHYLQKVIKSALDQTPGKKEERIEQQITVCNNLIDHLADFINSESFREYKISENAQKLLAIYEKIKYQGEGKERANIPRPESPLNISSIFTGSNIEPSLVSEWKKEIKSADEINLIVSFIRWSGVRRILNDLREFTKEKNHNLRIITTTYTGATQVKAINELAKLNNTKIKISYDTNRTRLHAKVYIFKRNTGFGTAYVGSSNLSYTAISSGLEWNMKISQYENKTVFEKCVGTFESYWNDREFKEYKAEEKEVLTKAIHRAKHFGEKKDYTKTLFKFDIKPYTFQEEILDELEAERVIHNRYKNLIVSATGTGKTVVSAFDYKRFREKHPDGRNRLLFIAHRQEILEQSIACYRGVLKNENFGDLLVGNYKPAEGYADHLFISIQSFNSKDIEKLVDPHYFDYIVIDEFHHAAADSYQVIFDNLKPKVLLGLTATPERMDGKSIIDRYFDGHIAAEIRLREAINRKLLCPFQYFGVSDSTDLSQLEWTRGGYKTKDLERIFVEEKGNLKRAETILNAVKDYVANIEDIKGLGFCVSKKHAHFMAKYFDDNGISSFALDSDSPDEERQSVKDKLRRKKIHFIFVVDLYNEGVDIPDVNTVLFLRPTESLRIFIQQLGRGLRLSEGKDCLTVLDFVGRAHKNYKFAEKFRALIGKTRHSVKEEIEKEFPNVPKGCYIELEKQAQQHILENISSAINNVRTLRRKIKNFAQYSTLDLNLKNFLDYTGIEIWWLYKASSVANKGWNRLCVQAEVRKEFKSNNPDEKEIVKGIQRLTLTNSRRFLKFIKYLFDHIDEIDTLTFTEEEKLMLSMFHYTIWYKSPKKCGFQNYREGIQQINKNSVMRNELLSVVDYNLEHINFVDKQVDLGFPCPLDLHCKYTSDQILAAMGEYSIEQKKPLRGVGVKYLEEKNCELLFITLNKSEKDYSPSTMYHDYSINEWLFHWQSQSTIADYTPTGQR
ncbi:MAG: DEAD/DEAH box helicase family protein, partial [Promethearchaeia archaeon]